MADAVKKSNNGMKIALIVVAGLVAFVMASAVVGFGIKTLVTPSKSEQVNQAVQEAKKQIALPAQIDQATTLTSIEASGDSAIAYQYELAGIDDAQVTDASLRSTVTPSACGQQAVKDVLEKDISLIYNYTVKETGKKAGFTLTKSDC